MESSGGDPQESLPSGSESGPTTPPPTPTPTPSSIAADLQRTLLNSTDTAIRSARSLREAATSEVKRYEESLFKVSREHPLAAAGLGLASALLLLRRPRRLLLRHTLGRFRSEEAHFARADNNVKELSLSLEMMKNESRKLLERASLAERDMRYGHTNLLQAGNQIQRLAKSVYKLEAQAADLMDTLRETPGRDALKLRAEVASALTLLKTHKLHLHKRIINISDLGLPV